MPLFGRKKEEIEKEIKDIEEIKKAIEPTETLPKTEEKPSEPERPAFAPLFVKLDRYKTILDSLAELKTTIAAIKNAFVSLIELENLKRENLKIIQNAIGKVEKKLVSLDSEFLRPSGYEEVHSEFYSIDLEPSIADLKSQIEKLKSELESIR